MLNWAPKCLWFKQGLIDCLPDSKLNLVPAAAGPVLVEDNTSCQHYPCKTHRAQIQTEGLLEELLFMILFAGILPKDFFAKGSHNHRCYHTVDTLGLRTAVGRKTCALGALDLAPGCRQPHWFATWAVEECQT